MDTIGSMLEEVTRLTKLVENLLTISRADAGQIQLNFTTFSPLELAREVIALVEILAEERAQKLRVSGDENLRVRGDRSLLRQAIINVLHNAVKYSPVDGTVFISVDPLPPDRVIIKISDSGPGLPLEHRAKIFDRFYRIDAGRARDTGGTGLGLAIANWAVTAQGGQIRAENSGEGAIFTLELQAAEAEADHQAPKRTETPVETRRLFG
jgi:signal transduction histidine kinase